MFFCGRYGEREWWSLSVFKHPRIIIMCHDYTAGEMCLDSFLGAFVAIFNLLVPGIFSR